MALTDLLVREVTILNPGTTVNGYGDTQVDWTTPTSVTVNGWVAQTSTIEDRNGRDTVTTALTLTVLPDAPLRATSHVVLDGVTYEVDGQPIAAWTPRGAHHIEANLKVVTG